MTLVRSVAMMVYLASFAFAQVPKASPEQTLPMGCTAEIITAKVELVYKTDEDGYQFNSYVITYHGKQVVVEDPIVSTTYQIGDEIRVLVIRNDMSKTSSSNKKLLHFIVGPKGA